MKKIIFIFALFFITFVEAQQGIGVGFLLAPREKIVGYEMEVKDTNWIRRKAITTKALNLAMQFSYFKMLPKKRSMLELMLNISEYEDTNISPEFGTPLEIKHGFQSVSITGTYWFRVAHLFEKKLVFLTGISTNAGLYRSYTKEEFEQETDEGLGRHLSIGLETKLLYQINQKWAFDFEWASGLGYNFIIFDWGVTSTPSGILNLPSFDKSNSVALKFAYFNTKIARPYFNLGIKYTLHPKKN